MARIGYLIKKVISKLAGLWLLLYTFNCRPQAETLHPLPGLGAFVR